jgi:hypothetical protein
MNTQANNATQNPLNILHRRVVLRGGIHLLCRRYQAPELAALHGQTVTAVLDARTPDCIQLHDAALRHVCTLNG